MCEIQIIQKLGKEKINRADVGEFFKMMCFGSMGNNDAFGIFNCNTVFKKSGPFDASELDEHELTCSNFIIGHNRFSTNWSDIKNPKKEGGWFSIPKTTRRGPSKGWDRTVSWRDNMSNIFLPDIRIGEINLEDEGPSVEEEIFEDKGFQKKKGSKSRVNYIGHDRNRNHHPFELGDFILIHNGTISNAQDIHNKYNFQTTINTDSYTILELIDYFFKSSKIKDRVKRVSSAIQDTLEELTGKYSVVLYDKRGKNTFYFKNIMAPFSLCKYGDKILCGSTSAENLKYLYFGMEREDILIRNKRIYLITSDTKCPVVDVTIRKARSLSRETLYGILSSGEDYDEKMEMADTFLEKKLGFVPIYDFSFLGALKIATNNADGIREKIHKIVKKPRRRFGWYIIKASDVKPKKAMNRQHKLKNKVVKKVKLDKMKGGNK